MNIGITGVAYLANALIKAKKAGVDIGNYDLVLREYEMKEQMNAKIMSGSVEFVKNSYQSKIAGSELVGDALGFFRNMAIDMIDSSDLLKYNFMNYA